MSSNMLYLSTRLAQAGHSEYPKHLRKAIFEGDEQTLAIAISSAHFWNEHEQRIRKGKPYFAAVPSNAAEVLAEGEFNCFYMRGLCCRLLDEGVAEVEIYRAKDVANPRMGERVNHGDRLPCQDVLEDLRSRDHGASKIGIPRGPASGLSVRRTRPALP